MYGGDHTTVVTGVWCIDWVGPKVHGAKKTREQGAKECNIGIREPRILGIAEGKILKGAGSGGPPLQNLINRLSKKCVPCAKCMMERAKSGNGQNLKFLVNLCYILL